MSAYDQASILINRCKRILALVDTYVEKQTAATRTDLRSALMDEFKAPAIAPPLAAGSVGTPEFQALVFAYRRGHKHSDYIGLLNHLDAWGAQQREAGKSEALGLRVIVAQLNQRAEKAEARVRELSLDLLAAHGETDAALAHAKELAAIVDSFGTTDGITFILDK